MKGPFSAASLKIFATSGRLYPRDEVRREDSNDWVLASKVRGLFAGNHPPQRLGAHLPTAEPVISETQIESHASVAAVGSRKTAFGLQTGLSSDGIKATLNGMSPLYRFMSLVLGVLFAMAFLTGIMLAAGRTMERWRGSLAQGQASKKQSSSTRPRTNASAPRPEDDEGLAASSWESFVERAKNNIPNACEYWMQQQRDAQEFLVRISIIGNDVRRSNSLKAPISGEIRVVTREKSGVSTPLSLPPEVTHEIDLRFAWANGEWKFIDAKNPPPGFNLDKHFIGVLFRPEDAALTQQRGSRKAQVNQAIEAWKALEVAAKAANMAGRVGAGNVFEWRAFYLGLGDQSAGITFLYGPKDPKLSSEAFDPLGQSRREFLMRLKWDGMQWRFDSGEATILGSPAARLVGIKQSFLPRKTFMDILGDALGSAFDEGP